MSLPATPLWGVVVARVVPCHSWLGQVRWCWWWVAPRQSWLRVLGAVPGHSWLGTVSVSVELGGGFPVLCVFVARRVRAVFVLVCVLYVCGVCVGGGVGVGVSLACVGVCVCVCACVVCWWYVVAGLCFPRVGLAAGVGVGVVGVCCDWSLATPGRGF